MRYTLIACLLSCAPVAARANEPVAAAPPPAEGSVDAGPTDAGISAPKPQGEQAAAEPALDLGALPGLEAGPSRSNKPKERQAPRGILPVYETPEGWMALDRGGKRAAIPRGTAFLVIGSKAAGVLTSGPGTAITAACVDRKPAKVPAYPLSGNAQSGLGTPIIAIRVPRGRSLDTKQARFYPLVNEVNDETYQSVGDALRQAVLADLAAGKFKLKADDAGAQQYAKEPDPKKLQLKLDFGSKIRIAGMSKAFLLVEGANISKSFRRCVLLLNEDAPVGACADMPHDLMAETQLLEFVAYDPNGRGTPFILAYTTREPLWGHERWGFQLTPKGAKRFLMDAQDAKCREGF